MSNQGNGYNPPQGYTGYQNPFGQFSMSGQPIPGALSGMIGGFGGGGYTTGPGGMGPNYPTQPNSGPGPAQQFGGMMGLLGNGGAPNMGSNTSGFNTAGLGQFSGTQGQDQTQFGGADYGRIAAIQNLLQQNPNAAGYLTAMGMMPSINGVPLNQVMQGANTMSINGHGTGGGTGGGGGIDPKTGQYYTADQWLKATAGQMSGPPQSSPMQGQGGGASNLSQQLTNYQRTPSPFEQQTQNQISNMYANPTGFTQAQQSQLYNQATNPIALAQQQAMQNTQANAVQRGAANSNADIQDQLNRVAMQGAQGASQANINTGLGLAQASRQGTLGALGAANPLIHSQLQDTSSLRNTLLGANAMQQQLGNSNLSFLFGGR